MKHDIEEVIAKRRYMIAAALFNVISHSELSSVRNILICRVGAINGLGSYIVHLLEQTDVYERLRIKKRNESL